LMALLDMQGAKVTSAIEQHTEMSVTY
jgi:hypothetical protein